MICFLDKAFCSARCGNLSCHRNFTEELRERSRKWWSHDPDNAPIAFCNFAVDCEHYIEVKDDRR